MTRFLIYNNNNLQTDARKYVSLSSPTSGLLGEHSQLIFQTTFLIFIFRFDAGNKHLVSLSNQTENGLL